MKRTSSPYITALVVVVALSVVVGLAWAEQPAPAPPLASSPDGLSNRELLDAFDEASVSDADRAVSIAERLWQRRKEIPRRDILSAITDTSRPQASRELMVDLLAGPPEEARASDDVRDLLCDRRVNAALKARTIADYRFGRPDASLLSSLACGAEELVAFHALKKLSEVDPGRARQLALSTISRADDASDSKLSAAYKVLVRSETLEIDRPTRVRLLHHLESVLADDDTSPALRDSATFALSDMRSLDAVRTLLGSQSIDRPLIVGAIEENAAVIKDAVEQHPSLPTIELAITAMELYPVKDMAEPLYAVRTRVWSSALRQRLDQVLVGIARDGVAMNPKWTEK